MNKYTIRHHRAFDGKTRVFLINPTRTMIMGSDNLKKYIKTQIDIHQSEIEYWKRLKKINDKASQGVDED